MIALPDAARGKGLTPFIHALVEVQMVDGRLA